MRLLLLLVLKDQPAGRPGMGFILRGYLVFDPSSATRVDAEDSCEGWRKGRGSLLVTGASRPYDLCIGTAWE